MFNLKKEKIKKNLFLTVLILSGFILIAGVMCTIMGENSPVKFIINESPVKIVILPALVFLVTFILYKNSQKSIKRNYQSEKK